MTVKKARCAEVLIQFASMWNMDGIVVIGFCNQDDTCLRNHIRILIAVYDGYCEHPERLLNLTIDHFSSGRNLQFIYGFSRQISLQGRRLCDILRK